MPPEVQSWPSHVLTYRSSDLIRYAAASGDFNPIHYDSESARSAGLPGIVVHGMLNMAVVGRYLDMMTQGRYRPREWKARFKGFVQPDQAVRLDGKMKRHDPDGALVVAVTITIVGEVKPALVAEAVLIPSTPRDGDDG